MTARRSSQSRIRTAVRTRAPGGDEGIALITTLVSIVLTAMLSILLLGIVVSQLTPTAFLRTSSRTVFGAEAGVNAVIGQIRTAAAPPDVTNTVWGDTNKLPCTAEGPVDGSGSGLTYEASVQYYLKDPNGRSPQWLVDNAIPCVPGSGPAMDPAFALITSRGVGGGVAGMDADAGDRTVSVVYEFQITNANIPGGLLWSHDADQTPDRFCLQAYSATPGAYVKYVPAATCGSDNVHQMWIYDKTYQLKLASTTLPGVVGGPLCITAPVGSTIPQRATLRACEPPDAATRWNQLFSWEGNAVWQGQRNPISSGPSNLYLYSGTASGSPEGRDLWIGYSKASRDEWGSFNPDPRVGAGAAGYETGQIVNYLEFGRCMDVTDVNVTRPYMIVFPCKQNPAGGAVHWNHRWYYEEPDGKVGAKGPQHLYVYQYHDVTKKYCLVSPNTEGGYVVLTSACSATAQNQQFTRYADTGNYASSYTFVDAWGRCLSLGDKYVDASNASKIITAACNSGLGQKWNAPPHVVTATLAGYQELP